MKDVLSIIYQKDVFPNQVFNNEASSFIDRITGKALVYDNERKIALVGNKFNSYFQLPGGGIKKGESVKRGIVREVLEETGCVVGLTKKIGVIEDYRNRDGKHCITHCYLGEVAGHKGSATLSEQEKVNGLYTTWMCAGQVISILEKQVYYLKNGHVTFYNTGFNILRDYLFVKKCFDDFNLFTNM